MKLKITGTIFALIGGILAFLSSFGYFFVGRMMGNMNYNQVDFHAREEITIIGIFILLLSIATLIQSLHAFKRHYSKGLFISLIVFGAILMALGSHFGGGLTLAGGIIGLTGVTRATKQE